MLDSNVLQALMQPTHSFHVRALEVVVAAQNSSSTLLLCPVVYAELHSSPGFEAGLLNAFFEDAGFEVDWDIPRVTWTLAGQAQATYHERRRKSGASQARRLMADFVIGAHALARDAILCSFDDGYSALYPALEIRSS